MIEFKSPRAEGNFRSVTAAIHTSYCTSRVCSKCGQRRPLDEVVRRGRNTRFDPTRWECRGGCDVR